MLPSILIAFIVVTAIGLIAAVLLALASYFLSVKEDERVSLVRNCLPGANCGACGYAGCDEYAKAVTMGGVEVNLCVPGGQTVTADVSKILGIDGKAKDRQVAFVSCNGTSDATSTSFNYDGVRTCKAASMVYGGPMDCKHGCIGCGDCAKICPVNAICVDEKIARVNRNICIGCGLCVKECPKNIIKLIPQNAVVAVMCNSKDKGAVSRKKCKNSCIGCKKCELNCPSDAIKVIDNLAVIDYSKCTNCGKCAEVCVTGCIKVVNE